MPEDTPLNPFLLAAQEYGELKVQISSMEEKIEDLKLKLKELSSSFIDSNQEVLDKISNEIEVLSSEITELIKLTPRITSLEDSLKDFILSKDYESKTSEFNTKISVITTNLYKLGVVVSNLEKKISEIDFTEPSKIEVSPTLRVYHLDPQNGDDKNSGESPMKAKKTMEAVLDIMPGALNLDYPNYYNKISAHGTIYLHGEIELDKTLYLEGSGFRLIGNSQISYNGQRSCLKLKNKTTSDPVIHLYGKYCHGAEICNIAVEKPDGAPGSVIKASGGSGTIFSRVYTFGGVNGFEIENGPNVVFDTCSGLNHGDKKKDGEGAWIYAHNVGSEFISINDFHVDAATCILRVARSSSGTYYMRGKLERGGSRYQHWTHGKAFVIVDHEFTPYSREEGADNRNYFVYGNPFLNKYTLESCMFIHNGTVTNYNPPPDGVSGIGLESVFLQKKGRPASIAMINCAIRSGSAGKTFYYKNEEFPQLNSPWIEDSPIVTVNKKGETKRF